MQPDGRPAVLVSDAARRARDIINGQLAAHPWADVRNCFMAIRLSDGGSDGVIYGSKADAVRHQLDEKLCAYMAFRNIAAGVTAEDMQLYLDFHRGAYDAGMSLVDPDDQFGGPDVVEAVTREDVVRQIAAMGRRRHRGR